MIVCGIAGTFSLGKSINEKDVANVSEMTAILHHRGPDAIGFYDDDKCSIGNTRLKILDLSDNAALPMQNEDGTVWITYNGEVTNFRELKQQYKLEQNHRFKSTSDTEVLIHLYEEVGIDFLNLLSGQFTFALYDKKKGKAYVVRDFYGIRPLFYMIAGERFYFASEIKSFLDLPEFDNQIDTEAIYHYFSLAYIPDELTPFRMIREVAGGSLFEIDLKTGQCEPREYYNIQFNTDYSITENNIVDKLHGQMLDSVRRNLISDAPLGLTLSGGFDTSSILTLVKELGANQSLHTFSIVMDEPSFNERSYQKIMVDFAKPIHHEIVVRPSDVMETLVEHMAFLDEPSGDGAALPSYLLAKDAKQHVSVLLSGEGGDETFNAYETHLAYKVRKLYRKFTPKVVRMLAYWVAHQLPCTYSKLSFDWLAKRFTEGAEKGTAQAHHHWRQVLAESEKKLLMPGAESLRRTDSFFSDLYDGLDWPEGLNRISLVDLKYFFIGDLMVKNDRMIMAHSIEARFPFMDRILHEFVSKIPPAIRIKGFTRRYIQKRAMKGYIPDAIYNRNNMGLEMPHSAWFMGGLKSTAEHYFSKQNVQRCGIISPEIVERLWGEHKSKRRDNGRTLWCILTFLIWFDLFVYNKDYKKYLTRAPLPTQGA
jgi:asparagine synthase (glutamine-hydrolysing)